ncbi:MAG TPA: coenzyme F420-0:L-glutamate ligase [Ktedonobacterales bacterium]|jgi:coenzyme F420-0:L-glutamate ligase/coenzyme F420-1:gamma-L-glutamate ligase
MSHATPSPEMRLIGLSALPEVTPGMDLAELARNAVRDAGETLHDGDVLVVTHKIVAKAEGRLVDLRTVEPSDFAREWAAAWGKDPRHVEVVLRESARVVRMDRGVLITQTRHGFVCANAGVDASNVPGEEVVCLLPLDPDATALTIHRALREATGAHVAVIIADSFGRPWRNGIVNVAIGVAGIAPLVDYRGQADDFGRTMQVSVLAVADELASAAELVMGKVSRCPMALIRGYPFDRHDGTARELVMDPTTDMFR